MCDGIKDCPSGKDEDSCPTTTPEIITTTTSTPTVTTPFACDNGDIIPIEKVCIMLFAKHSNLQLSAQSYFGSILLSIFVMYAGV